MRTIKVKASSVTHLTDARYFAAREVDWLGYSLDPADPAALDARQVAALREWVDGPMSCGEFGLADAADILAQARALGLDAVQVNMLAPVALLEAVAKSGLSVLVERVVEHYAEADELEAWFQERAPYAAAFVLNFAKGGIEWADLVAGSPIGLDAVSQWTDRFPLLLEIELGDVNPVDAWRQLPALGFSLRGGAEEKTGYKSFDELDEWFDAWEMAE